MTPFVFHVSSPNNEDVEPVISRRWLAVADGMGGSGCMVHVVPDHFRDSLDTVLGYVLPEYSEESDETIRSAMSEFITSADGKASYLERIFAPCIDKAENTSARWASRIVMGRFLYYITAEDCKGRHTVDREYVDSMGKFMMKGLRTTVEHLKLTVDSRDKTLLPTTFAALHYDDISDSECEVQVAWAGDSRCYVLDASGLRKLSQDDENDDGMVNNCLCADDEAYMNYRTYRLRKPFVLMGASDGFFDAYGKLNITVEALLLEDIFAADSEEQFKQKFYDRYALYLGDDTSVAFLPVGFVDYTEFKNVLSHRYARIKSLFDRHREYGSIVALIDKPESDVTMSICERVKVKFSGIIEDLVKSYYEGKEDILLTEQIVAAVKERETQYRNEVTRRIEERKAELYKALSACFRSRSYAECFQRNGGFDLRFGCIDSLRNAEARCEKAREKSEQLTATLRSLEQDVVRFRRALWAKQEELARNLTDSLRRADEVLRSGGKEQRIEGQRREMTYRLYLNEIVECYLVDPNYDISVLKGIESYKECIAQIRTLHGRWRDYEARRKALDAELFEAAEKREAAVQKVVEKIPQLVQNRDRVFTQKLIDEFGMDAIFNGEIDEEDLRKSVTRSVVSRYGDDDALRETTIAILKSRYDDVSCVDERFTARKLSDFRKYYKYRNARESQEFVSYREELESIERECDALLENGENVQQPKDDASRDMAAPDMNADAGGMQILFGQDAGGSEAAIDIEYDKKSEDKE